VHSNNYVRQSRRSTDLAKIIPGQLEVMRDLAHPLAEAYRRRWGIETSYRKVTGFLPKTSSPTFSVRLYYFLFAVALYNLWVVTNLLLTAERAVGSTPVLPTALFRQFLGPVPNG
jgi:IS4 transposase